jgi:hypothetical protein
MLNRALQNQLLLDAGTHLTSSHHGLPGSSALQHAEFSHHLQPRDAEKETLLHRLSEMELVLQQQQHVNVQAQQTITKLQAQIILLEERYRLTPDGVDQLQDECLGHQAGAFRGSADVDIVAAKSSSLSPAALRSAVSMAGASAFAAAASAGTSVLETSSSGGSSSTTTAGPASSSVPSGGGDSSSSSAEGVVGHGPWSQGTGFHAFGLNPAPSAPSHLAGDLSGASLPMLQPSLDMLVSPLPTSLSGLSRSLSLSATAASAKQQHKPRQPGGSAGGALGIDNNGGSEEFMQVRRWSSSVAVAVVVHDSVYGCDLQLSLGSLQNLDFLEQTFIYSAITTSAWLAGAFHSVLTQNMLRSSGQQQRLQSNATWVAQQHLQQSQFAEKSGSQQLPSLPWFPSK